METQLKVMNTELRVPLHELEQPDLLRFFTSHLNRIYCAKKQLIEKLPELYREAHFLDLRQAIEETVEMVSGQIKRMEQIYLLLHTTYQMEDCIALVGLLDEAFQSIGPQSDKGALRDLSILFYMRNIESIEMASFGMLMRIADELDSQEIVQLLRECYDEAREDKMLLKQITENYL